MELPPNVVEIQELRNRIHVFRDRVHAGEILAEMLDSYSRSDAIVLAVPAGGVPVAAVVAKRLQLPLEVAVVSKITLPWDTEAGYGAVAFDGTVLLNRELILHLGLKEREIQDGQYKTSQKVARRLKKFRGDAPYPDLSQRTALLIDDGLASGFTMLTAVEALRKAPASMIVIAVPTGSLNTVNRIAPRVDTLYCANIRSGWSFAVADAYERWSDVDEDEAISIYKRANNFI